MARKQKPAKVIPGTANLAEAPGGLRRFFRFSQLALGEAGGARNIEDIWATVLQELDDLNVPAEARTRIESLGARTIIGKGGRLPESIVKLAGNKENVQAIKDVIKAARAATLGVSPAALTNEVKRFIDLLAKDPSMADENGRRIIAELRKADPKAIARVGATQTVSALSARGQDPTVVRLYRKMLKRTPTARLPESIETVLKEASAGRLPKVTGATRAVLGKEIASTGKAAAAGRTALGGFGRSLLGTGALAVGVGIDVHRVINILGKEGRAKRLALTGFQGAGPSSSTEFLRDTVRQQEAIARRKATMQQFEPELFHSIIRALSDTGASKETLTSTERRIGSDARAGAQSRGRDPQDVEFLLDQLFSQLGG